MSENLRLTDFKRDLEGNGISIRKDGSVKELENTGTLVDGIPEIAFQTLMPIGQKLIFQQGKKKFEITYCHIDNQLTLDQMLPTETINNMYGFQKEGVSFGLQNNGRVLIADEMGVGKTIQAICLASCYKRDWPLLVICPSSLKYNWKEEILKWDNTLEEHQIQIFQKQSDNILSRSKVLICSYDTVPKILDKLARFQANIAIADEAHYLKNSSTKRTEAILPFLQKMRRVILLTGTPAFARPKEMFTLLQIVRPDVFKHFKPFGERYCDPSRSKFGQGMDYQGSSNEKELHFILKKTLMIRRLKSEVLSQLPRKRRKKVLVNIDPKILREIQEILHHTSKSSLEQLFDSAYKQIGNKQEINDDSTRNCDQSSQFAALSLCYQLSGLAKLEELKNYIRDLIDNEVKLIIFAHHLEMLNKLEAFVTTDLKKKSIRIDGQVSSKERYDRVQQFQNDVNVRVAVLSLSAASTGLTLTASSNIIFAEMHWTPALMQQAEDRAHRIGQENSVLCHYIVGEQTLDDILYRKIEQKIAIVSNILDGQRKNLKMDLIRDAKGQEILENEEEEDIEGVDEGKISQQEYKQVSEQKQKQPKSLENTAQKPKNEIISKQSASESISDDSDEDDEDLIEMMALKRIAEQELQRRKSQLQQAQLRWGTLQTTEELEAADKKSSNIKSTFPVQDKSDIQHPKRVIHNIESNNNHHNSNYKTSKKKNSEEEITSSSQSNSIYNAPISLNTPEKSTSTQRISQSKPLTQESLNQQSSHSQSIKKSKELFESQITENVKEKEITTSEQCKKPFKMARGLEFIEKSQNQSSHINANLHGKVPKPHVPQPDEEDGFEISIDFDAELEEDKGNEKNTKQTVFNLDEERKGLQCDNIVEKLPQEEQKELSALPNLLDNFFEQQKFIPRFSSSSSSVSKRNSQGSQQTSSAIRSRAAFLEDAESPWEQEQAAKKLKKPAFYS